jgi:hypothetical protein
MDYFCCFRKWTGSGNGPILKADYVQCLNSIKSNNV